MSFPTRVRTSWQLLQCSLEVLRTHPRLLVLPALATVCLMLIAFCFMTPLFVLILREGSVEKVDAAAQQYRGLFWLSGGLIYVVSMVLGTFFNVAFFHELLRAFAGETISLQRGWQFALSRLGPILSWSLLAATVGLLIRTIEERLGWLGRFVLGLVGTTWSVAAVFAIPVLVRRTENNPLAVLRASAAMLKRTWGETLVGFLGLHLAGAIIIGSLIIGVLAVAFIALLLHLWWIPLGLLLVGAVVIIAAAVLLNVATDVYRGALYVYASEGVVPTAYTEELMTAGWKRKK
jgi:hypothetical protein